MRPQALLMIGVVLALISCPVSALHAAQTALSTALEEAIQYYESGAYARAESLLTRLTKTASTPLNWTWLGRVYVQQKRLKKAEKAFKKAVRLDEHFAPAYTGLGMVASRRPKHGMEAQRYFEKAIHEDPRDAEPYYQLALIFLRWTQHYLEGPLHRLQARKALQQAIALNPNHPDAHYQLGLTYEQAGQYARALPHFRRQIEVHLTHEQAGYHLATAYLKTGQYLHAVRLLTRLIEIDSTNTTLYAQLAEAYQYAGDYPQALDTYERLFRLLDQSERRYYFDLSYLAAPDESPPLPPDATATDSLQAWRKFWGPRDPLLTTPVNERLVEHYRRVTYARTHFGKKKTPWDRRGDLYLRYGPPDDLQRYTFGLDEDKVLTLADRYPPNSDLMVNTIRQVNDAYWQQLINAPEGPRIIESWVYVELDMELFFVDYLRNGLFDFPKVVSGRKPPTTLSYMIDHPATRTELAVKQIPETYHHDYGAEPLQFVFESLAFRKSKFQAQLLFPYLLPVPQLGVGSDSAGAITAFEQIVVAFNDDWQEIGRTDRTLGPFHRPTMAAERSAVFGMLNLNLPPGQYHTAIQIRDRATRKLGIYRQDVTVPDYGLPVLTLSDILLASSAVAAAADGSELVRGGYRLQPNPSHRFAQTRPVYLYGEIYNLSLDADGRTHYQTEVIVQSTQPQKSIGSRLLSSTLGRLIGRQEEQDTVTLTFEHSGVGRPSSNEPLLFAIDLSDSSPGRYEIGVKVTDQHTGASTEANTQVILVQP